ncbi:MAG: hypothetical protein M3P32_00130 [Chloroflexota bacterium]|nr:hypothetical protein [Chloroflexota bacterium]
MSIRLDPRRLGALKLLAAEAGVRPGELVTRWVEERLDSARGGAAPSAIAPDGLAALAARVEDLARRLDQMASAAVAEPATTPTPTATMEAPIKRGRGRPRKVVDPAASTARPARASNRRASARPKARAASKVALHDEILAVIAERGPQTAAELASAIAERGRYHPPRSAKPLDAAAVNARVSNPTYRSRFARREHRIGLAVE